MYGSTVLDKDGISSLVAAAEYATSLYKNGSNFAEELQKIYQKYVVSEILPPALKGTVIQIVSIRYINMTPIFG